MKQNLSNFMPLNIPEYQYGAMEEIPIRPLKSYMTGGGVEYASKTIVGKLVKNMKCTK